jgi:hypothetical protein
MVSPGQLTEGEHAMSASPAAITQDALPVTPAHDRRVHRAKPRLTVAPDRRARAPSPLAGTATDAHRLDEKSRAWLDALRSDGRRREHAIGSLHALLVRQARFEVGWRTASLAHPSGRDLDDLAVQAADDAVVAILAKLDQFRGERLGARTDVGSRRADDRWSAQRASREAAEHDDGGSPQDPSRRPS